MACVLVHHLLGGAEVRVTQYGDAADYWISDLHLAIEVSGTESPGQMRRRQREKAAQVRRNPAGWDGYVVVVCFSPAEPRVVFAFEQQGKVER